MIPAAPASGPSSTPRGDLAALGLAATPAPPTGRPVAVVVGDSLPARIRPALRETLDLQDGTADGALQRPVRPDLLILNASEPGGLERLLSSLAASGPAERPAVLLVATRGRTLHP